MSRRIMMVGKETEQVRRVRRILELREYEVTHYTVLPDRISGTDLLFIACSAIPSDGVALPAGIPVLAYCQGVPKSSRRIPDIEILDVSEMTDEVFAECICTRLNEYNDARRQRLCYRDLVMDLRASRVTVAGERINLSGNEFRLLQYLMENQGTILTREEIMKKIWGSKPENENKAVEVYISHIREKIDDVCGKTYISTIRGKGYVVGRELIKSTQETRPAVHAG